MDNYYKQLFAQMEVLAPSPELHTRILREILVLHRKKISYQWRLFVCLAIANSILFIGSIAYIIKLCAATGATDYVSLMLSDGATALSLWKEFGIVILESLPLVEVSVAVCLFGCSVWLLKRMVEVSEIRGTMRAAVV